MTTYEDGSFLGCSTVHSCGSRLTFRRCVLPHSLRRLVLIVHMMEVVRSSETSVYLHENERRYIPERCLIFILDAVRT
jgi:hypothetical protein